MLYKSCSHHLWAFNYTYFYWRIRNCQKLCCWYHIPEFIHAVPIYLINTAQPYGFMVAHQAPLSMDSLGRNTGNTAIPLLSISFTFKDSIHISNVSELAGRFLTTSTIWEAQEFIHRLCNILLTFLWLQSYHSLITYYSSQYVAFIHSLFKN